MQIDLLNLFKQTEQIKNNFHYNKDNLKMIYDIPEFVNWKQEVQLELQDIFDRTNDSYIWDALVNVKQGFNGWNDERDFNKLSGNLIAITKNIKRYYPNEIENIHDVKEKTVMNQKKPIIFISHADLDKDYALQIVNLLEGIGITGKQLFCSSVPGYSIPLCADIYEHLKKQFEEYDLHVIFVLSQNFYKSAACLNEMGAAWVLQKKYTTILLPNFEFKEIEGAINPRQNSIKLDGVEADLKDKLRQLKNNLEAEFELTNIIPVARWEVKRDDFINSILKISP